MSTNRNLLTSPVGSIQFMAVENPMTDKKTNKQHYSIKLALDVKKDAAFLKQINEINDAKVVTASTYRGKSDELRAILATGKAFVESKSKFKPQVYDSKGNPLEEAPLFFADSSGTAQMIVEPYHGEKGGTINLVGVIVHNVENKEATGDGTDREARLAQLRAVVDAATK